MRPLRARQSISRRFELSSTSMARPLLVETMEPEVEIEVEVEATTKTIPRWKVILHNDEITTMDFVVDLLVKLFHKKHAEAVRLMYEVHDSSCAVVEITSFERGELYVDQIRSLARPRGFPLLATLEPE